MLPRLFRLVALAGLAYVGACEQNGTEPDVVASPAGVTPERALASNTWTTRRALSGTERTGLASAVARNAAAERSLYVIGGSSSTSTQPTGITSGALATVQAYDPMTNSWSTKAPLPLALYLTNGAVTLGGKIYVSGGRTTGDTNFQRSLFVYDPATNTWTRKRDMPDKTWGGVSGAIGGKLYVLTCGGEETCSVFDRLAVYRYDPAIDEWTVPSVTPIELGEPLGGVLDKKFYVTGGPDGALLVYDPVANTWAQKAKLPKHRFAGAAATLGGELYIMGGLEVDPWPNFTRTQVRKTTVYNPATNTWTEKARMPSQRFLVSASRITVNGVERIAVVGGQRPGNHLHYIP